MKKILYCILLAAVLFVDVTLVMSLWISSVFISVALAVIPTVALIVWRTVLLVRATDDAVKKRSLLIIALSTLIPIAVFIATYVVIAIAFVIMLA